MSSQKPPISVLMTAYNRQQFIAEAIESVLASTYHDFELLVSDDCSTDDTIRIVNAYAEKDKRVQLYVNEKNLGDYPNRNKVAGYASGEFIMYVDSDDVLYPNTIAQYVDFITRYPALNFAIYCTNCNADISPRLLNSTMTVRNHFFGKSCLLSGPGGILIRNEFFITLGGFPEKYGPANDSYFNVKVASKTDVLSFSFIPLYYRKHDAQESKNLFSYIYNNYQFNKDLINKEALQLFPEEKKIILKKNKRRFLVNLIKYLTTTGNFGKTHKLVKKASFTFKDAFDGVFH